MSSLIPRPSSVVILLVALVTGCSSIPTPAGPTATPTRLSTPTFVPVGLTPKPGTPSIEPGQAITLTLWTTAGLAPDGETCPAPCEGTPAGQVLSQQLAAFLADHPNVHIQTLLKKPGGTGGLFDFLQTASAVAPATLPDLMILDAADLPKAAQAGLIQPLDDVVGAAADDLFPFARALATVNGQLMGMPYIVSVEHVAYNPTRLEAAPLTWTDVISAGVRFAFPAGESTHADTLISLYLSIGGTLTDASGAPHLEVAPLIEMLRSLETARHAGITTNATQAKSTEDTWVAFRSGTPLAVVSAERYLADRTTLGAVAAGPLPGWKAPAPSLGSAWVWVLVTRDPLRAPLAQQLLLHLTTPENLGHWSHAAAVLPARRSALATWETLSEAPDPYLPFLQELLEKAVARPPAAVYTAIAPALRQAVEDVLLGRATPETAAAAAVRNVRL
ncbi:MAG: hypothetical protein C4311_14370 [Chloroflexota bacterium]